MSIGSKTRIAGMATKDGEKTGGREKGTPNKFTGTVKEAYLEVFQRLGGVDGLHKWASSSEANKREFYRGFMKILPREVHLVNPETPNDLPFRLVIEGQEQS